MHDAAMRAHEGRFRDERRTIVGGPETGRRAFARQATQRRASPVAGSSEASVVGTALTEAVMT